MKFKFLDKVKIIDGFYKGQVGIAIGQNQLHSYIISLQDILVRPDELQNFELEIHEDYLEKYKKGD